MKIVNLVLLASMVMTASSAFADVCGIVRQGQGRVAANLIDNQVKLNGGTAKLYEAFNNEVILVTDARVSNKKGYDANDGKVYFDFIVTLPDNSEKTIDLGHTFLFINKNKLAINLEHLTGCSATEYHQAVMTPEEIAAPRMGN